MCDGILDKLGDGAERPSSKKEQAMGIGISIFVGTVGAILRYAVTSPTNQHGFNIHTGGVILMIVGAIGLIFSAIFWRGVSPFGRDSTSRHEEIVTQNGHEQGHTISETRDHVAR